MHAHKQISRARPLRAPRRAALAASGALLPLAAVPVNAQVACGTFTYMRFDTGTLDGLSDPPDDVTGGSWDETGPPPLPARSVGFGSG
ncbi:hypothetical protein ACH427_05110 [Streptomyces sp. NPDC020379]|uniref:hypothetical protein n=1 Tax=Streptomyces sp. NPDC020379 TaxID=3365071 RepID=UPI0037913606